MMFSKSDYVKKQTELHTSAELIYAIEQYAGQMIDATPSNKAYEIWGVGAEGKLSTEQEKEILKHVPIEHAKDRDILFWAAEGYIAECVGGEWRLSPKGDI